MTTSQQDSSASLDLASLQDNVDADEHDMEPPKDNQSVSTGISREDLMSSFSKFDSIVGSMDAVVDEDASDDTLHKFLEHYEAAQSDIEANLRAFQSEIESKRPTSEKENQQENEGGGSRKGLRRRRRRDRTKSRERVESMERRLEASYASEVLADLPDEVLADLPALIAKSKEKEAEESPAAVQDLREVHMSPCPRYDPSKDDKIGMWITVNLDEDPLNESIHNPTKAPPVDLPDPSTMTAKEILEELEKYNRSTNFIEKPEMIKALIDARSKAKQSMNIRQINFVPKAEKRRISPKPEAAPKGNVREIKVSPKPPASSGNVREIKVSPRPPSANGNVREIKSIPKAPPPPPISNDAPRTPRSRPRGRSTEPTSPAIKAHLESLKDLMDLDISKPKELETPRRRRKQLQKPRANSLNTFEIDESDLKDLKKNGFWWNLASGGGGVDEGSKTSKSTKNSKNSKDSDKKRNKSLRRVLSSNDLQENDEVPDFEKYSLWNLLSGGGGGDEGSKSTKNSKNSKDSNDKKRNNSLRRALSSNDMKEGEDEPEVAKSMANSIWNLVGGGGGGGDEGSKTSKSTKNSKNSKDSKDKQRNNSLRRVLSSNDIRDEDEPEFSVWNTTGGDEGSKTSKGSKNSKNSKDGKRKGWKKVLSSSDLGKEEEDEPEFVNANVTPKRRNRSLKNARPNSIGVFEFDEKELETAAKKSSSWWNLRGGDDGSKSSKESKDSRRNKGMRKVRSTNDIEAPLTTDTPRRRKKKYMQKSLSNPTLEIDAPPLFDAPKSPGNAPFDLGGGVKKKSKMPARRSSSDPRLEHRDRSSSRPRRNNAMKGKPGSKVDIDELFLAKSQEIKKKSMAMRKVNSDSNLFMDDAPTTPKSFRPRGVSKSRLGPPPFDTGIPREILLTPKKNKSLEKKSKSARDLTEGGSQYEENQTVWYTSSDGKMQEAIIVKIHLDNSLVPFYDIKLVESGNEKQTDDGHLSAFRRPRRSKSVDGMSAADPSTPVGTPVTTRRRLKVNHHNAQNAKSPVSIRAKMPPTQSPGTVRKAFRVL